MSPVRFAPSDVYLCQCGAELDEFYSLELGDQEFFLLEGLLYEIDEKVDDQIIDSMTGISIRSTTEASPACWRGDWAHITTVCESCKTATTLKMTVSGSVVVGLDWIR